VATTQEQLKTEQKTAELLVREGSHKSNIKDLSQQLRDARLCLDKEKAGDWQQRFVSSQVSVAKAKAKLAQERNKRERLETQVAVLQETAAAKRPVLCGHCKRPWR
jgi:hypothetical protein